MTEKDGNTFSETFTVATENLADKIKELIEQGNARRVIVRNKNGKELVNVPLTGSAIAGGAFVLAAPLVSAIGVIAALASSVQVEVIRDEPTTPQGASEETIAIQLTPYAENND